MPPQLQHTINRTQPTPHGPPNNDRHIGRIIDQPRTDIHGITDDGQTQEYNPKYDWGRPSTVHTTAGGGKEIANKYGYGSITGGAITQDGQGIKGLRPL